MTWILEHRRGWRVAFLGLVVLAILGPWVFERLYIPATYACTAPYVRLDGNFCGGPMPGTWMIALMLLAPFASLGSLFSGTMALADFWREFWRGCLLLLVLLLFLLPIFSTLRLVLRRDRPRPPLIHVVLWGLAAGAGLWFGLSNYPGLFWVLWGAWLYIGSAAGSLVLEVCLRVAPARSA